MATHPDEVHSIRYNAVDPTRTKTRRSAFQSAFYSRWRDVRGRNREWLSDLTRPYSPRLQTRYRDFFTTLTESTVLEPVSERAIARGDHWTAEYVRMAYRKGLELARSDLSEFDVPESIIRNATRESRSAHQSRLSQEYQTVYYNVEDIVSDARGDVTNSLNTAIQNDKSVTWLVDQTNAQIRSGVQNRSKATANTAVVRAVNEALLTTFEIAGVQEVGVAIESEAGQIRDNYIRVNASGELQFQTAEDENVCSVCRALAGKTVAISAVRGSPQFMPPVHPNCRCRLVPTSIEIKTTGEEVEVPESFTGGLRADST